MKIMKLIPPFNYKDLLWLVVLASKIPNAPYSKKDYLKHLNNGADYENGFFVAKDKRGDIVSMIEVMSPDILDKKVGFLLIGSSQPEVTIETNKKVLKLAEEWLKTLGADSWTAQSLRSPRAWLKRYGFKPKEDTVLLHRKFR